MKLLYQYIKWFKRQISEYSMSLKNAYKQLWDQLYNVKQIRKTEIQDWRDLNISLKLKKQLKKRIKEWDKERTSESMSIRIKVKRTDAVNSLMQLATAAEFLDS